MDPLTTGSAAIAIAPFVVGALKMLGDRFAPSVLAWVKEDPKRQEVAARLVSFAVGLLWAKMTGNPIEAAGAIGGASAFFGPLIRDGIHRLVLRK